MAAEPLSTSRRAFITSAVPAAIIGTSASGALVNNAFAPTLADEVERLLAYQINWRTTGFTVPDEDEEEHSAWFRSVLDRVSALPHTPGNLPLRLKAVRAIYCDDFVSEPLLGETAIDGDLARQIILTLVGR